MLEVLSGIDARELTMIPLCSAGMSLAEAALDDAWPERLYKRWLDGLDPMELVDPIGGEGFDSGADPRGSFHELGWPDLIEGPGLEAANVWEWLMALWNRARKLLWKNRGNLLALIRNWLSRVLARAKKDTKARNPGTPTPRTEFRRKTSPGGIPSVLFVSTAAKLKFLDDERFKEVLEEYVNTKGTGQPDGMAKGSSLRGLVMMLRRFSECAIDCYDVLMLIADDLIPPAAGAVAPLRPAGPLTPQELWRRRLFLLLDKAWRAAHEAYGRAGQGGTVHPPTGTSKDQPQHPRSP